MLKANKRKQKDFAHGDRFVVEIEDVYVNNSGFNGPARMYRMKGFNSLVFDEAGLRKLTQYKAPDTEAIRDDGYYNGARDAWELAQAICLPSSRGGLSGDELKEFFGTSSYVEVILNTFTEAKDKIETYRAKQAEKKRLEAEQTSEENKDSLRPGDIVTLASGETAVVVLAPAFGNVTLRTKGGFVNAIPLECTKTGKNALEVSTNA